jgi:hypothetical protein
LQRLPLAAWQLPSLREVRVEVTPTGGDPDAVVVEPLPVPEADGPASPGGASGGGARLGIPVPVVREVC